MQEAMFMARVHGRRPSGTNDARRVRRPAGAASRREAEMNSDNESVKSIEILVPVSYTLCSASTPGLSTWWSATTLKGELVLRWVSRLDAFSGYPVRT
jgi:hypothetical protein